MSYTTVQLKPSSISKEKKVGFVKIKKGLKVNCIVNKHEGDDDDGCFDRILTIAEVKTKCDYTYIRYEEIASDDWDGVFSEFYVKKEK